MSEVMTVDGAEEAAAATAEVETSGVTETVTETFILCALAGATYGIASREIAHLEMIARASAVAWS